jgi:predicted HAD superfamily Cof-like phosphohydrolase
MKDWLKKVSIFCKDVVELKAPDEPAVLSPDRTEFYIGAADEELQEFLDATATGDVGEAADALVDLIYFTLGRLYEMGVPADVVFDDVHKANMTKKRGIKKGRKVQHEDDAMKPEGWKPPDHSWLAYLPTEAISIAKALAFLASERENLERIERSLSNEV